MAECPWVLADSLEVLSSVAEPYLLTGQGKLGAHDVACHFAPESGHGAEFRVFLDGRAIFELGLATPGAGWFQLCQEQGYDPEMHWDLDPALILFRQVLTRLARGWGEQALPYNELGVPKGVVCLATVQEAWARGAATLAEQAKGDGAREQVAACFQALPVRAVVFHDDPQHREDYVGTGLDEPLLGVFLRLGRSRAVRLTLDKAILNGTGGLCWSAWEPGGNWREAGREFHATKDPTAFLEVLGELPRPHFAEAFEEGLTALARTLDPVVEAYRMCYPEGIPWHRDPLTRFIDHIIVGVRLLDGKAFLLLDDGTEVEVAEPAAPSVLKVSEGLLMHPPDA